MRDGEDRGWGMALSPGKPADNEPAATPGSVSLPRDIVLASLNVHGGRGTDGTPFDIGHACRQLSADLIVLQEAWHRDGQPDPVARVAEALGAQAIRAHVLHSDLRSLGITHDSAPGRWGLAVLTSLPVIRSDVVDLGSVPGDAVNRSALVVTVQVPGGASLRVANAHLTHRFLSPVQLVRLVRSLAACEMPTVIVGDLNMPGPVTGLAVGYSSGVSGRTFPAQRPLVQLDHLLTSSGVHAWDGKVLPPVGSDHLPIRARVRIG